MRAPENTHVHRFNGQKELSGRVSVANENLFGVTLSALTTFCALIVMKVFNGFFFFFVFLPYYNCQFDF